MNLFHWTSDFHWTSNMTHFAWGNVEGKMCSKTLFLGALIPVFLTL